MEDIHGCRSKDFDFDVLMMPCDHDVLIPCEHALLKLRSRQKSKRFKIHHKEDL